MTEPYHAHDPQYYEAGRIIKSLPYNISTQLFKTTRSGATTGFCANGFDEGMKITLLAPNIVIVTDTLNLSKDFSDIDNDKIILSNIPGNKQCMKIQAEIDKNPDLGHLSMIPLPMKCDKCAFYDECDVTEFLRSSNPHGVGLTHQKLNALMHSSSDTAMAIVDKLMTMTDLVIIDEAHDLETSNAATVCVYPYPSMQKYDDIKEKYTALSEFIDTFNRVRKNNEESVIQHFIGIGEEAMKQRMAINVHDYEGDEDEYAPPEFSKTVSAIKNIVEIMKHRTDWGLTVKDVVYLSDIVMTMAGSFLVMHYMNEDGADIVQLSSPGGLKTAMREYVIRCSQQHNCRIVFTSATFGDFYYGNMFGIDINATMMRDTRDTNKKITIHPDTYRISTYNYWREEGDALKQRIIKNIKKYADMYPDIRFMCMKKTVAYNLKKWLAEEGYDINTDYYRSTNTLGVACGDRRMVCVGAPVTAINAFDGVTNTYEESQKTRVNANHAAFWQAISRIKDPKGEEESHVYCIGIREEEVRMMCTWGVKRTIDMDGVKCVGVDIDNVDHTPIGVPNIEKISRRRVQKAISDQGEATKSNIMKKLRMSAKEVATSIESLTSDGIIASRVSDAKRKPLVFYEL